MVWSVGLRYGRTLTARGLFSLPPPAGARHVALGAEWRDGNNGDIQPLLTRVQQAALLRVSLSPRSQPTEAPEWHYPWRTCEQPPGHVDDILEGRGFLWGD